MVFEEWDVFYTDSEPIKNQSKVWAEEEVTSYLCHPANLDWESNRSGKGQDSF